MRCRSAEIGGYMNTIVNEAHFENETATELKQMISNTIATMDRNKAERKKLKEMLESAFLNDEQFRMTLAAVKDAKKKNDTAKLIVLENKATLQLTEKVKDIGAENKDLKLALNEYVREYAKLTGKTKVEIDDGRQFTIVPSYQLILEFK